MPEDELLPEDSYVSALESYANVMLLLLKHGMTGREAWSIREKIVFNFTARSVNLARAIVLLWKGGLFEECSTCLRGLHERYLLLNEFEDNNLWQNFDDFCFRNRVGDFEKQVDFLVESGRSKRTDFEPLSKEQRVRIEAIRKSGFKWKPRRLEDIAKDQNAGMLHSFGFHYHTGHVHPTNQDGRSVTCPLYGLPVPRLVSTLQHSVMICSVVGSRFPATVGGRWLEGVEDYFAMLREHVKTGKFEYLAAQDHILAASLIFPLWKQG